MTNKLRYFGPITTEIDHDRRRIEVSLAPRHGSKSEQLFDYEVSRCVSWALTSLGDLVDNKGYIISCSIKLDGDPGGPKFSDPVVVMEKSA